MPRPWPATPSCCCRRGASSTAAWSTTMPSSRASPAPPVQFDEAGGWWAGCHGARATDSFDLKKLGTFPIVHGVRALALQHRVDAFEHGDAVAGAGGSGRAGRDAGARPDRCAAHPDGAQADRPTCASAQLGAAGRTTWCGCRSSPRWSATLEGRLAIITAVSPPSAAAFQAGLAVTARRRDNATTVPPRQRRPRKRACARIWLNNGWSRCSRPAACCSTFRCSRSGTVTSTLLGVPLFPAALFVVWAVLIAAAGLDRRTRRRRKPLRIDRRCLPDGHARRG